MAHYTRTTIKLYFVCSDMCPDTCVNENFSHSFHGCCKWMSWNLRLTLTLTLVFCPYSSNCECEMLDFFRNIALLRALYADWYLWNVAENEFYRIDRSRAYFWVVSILLHLITYLSIMLWLLLRIKRCTRWTAWRSLGHVWSSSVLNYPATCLPHALIYYYLAACATVNFCPYLQPLMPN